MNGQHHQKEQRTGNLMAGARILVLLAAFAGPATAAEKRVDNPVDAWMIAQTGLAGKAVEGGWKRRFEILDTTDAKAGDFSIVFTVGDPAKESAFGFLPGTFIEHWAVSRDHALHLWAKAKAEQAPSAWSLVLVDTQAKRATAALNGMTADGKWREFTVPLKDLKADDGFDFGALRSVQVEAALPKDARLWLDDVYFKNGDTELGVSDKTITQYMAEAVATRQKRVEAALPSGGGAPGIGQAAALWAGRDLEKTNQDLLEWFRKEKNAANVAGNWDLHINAALNMLYFGFSSKGRLKSGRLTPACEKELLELYWKHCELKNDIATARHSTWWVTGSENHDINFKVANLLSSQIFMREPDYAKRVYPDLGRMHGYGYGGGFLMKVGAVKPWGEGKYKDGKDYTAEDHYKAWGAFWKEWFAERARHGFFIEHNAGGYMKYTNKFLHDIYAWCEDEDLRRQCRMFMDLIWAQWAQDQILTIQGGAATRGSPGSYAMSELSVFLLGGPANGGWGYFQMFSDYQWPRQVWEMMLDRRGKGEYAYASRKPNESQDLWPDPPGTEYTMLIRPDSRIKRYSWVTPDYVMGLRMDHPDALYCHLFGSHEGLIFPTDPNAAIVFGAGGYAVQDRQTALFMTKRVIHMRSPAWFGNYDFRSPPAPAQVNFGVGVDRVEEKEGWVFVEEGNAFAAFRIVAPAPQKEGTALPRDAEGFALLAPDPAAYTLTAPTNGQGWVLKAKASYSPVIVEASRRTHHANLEAFQKDVLDNPLELRQTMGCILTYRGCGDEAKTLYLNAATQTFPRIDGKPIDYNCPTFDSPYLKGAAGSGVVTLTGPISGKKLVLDFNKIERIEE
jgi:hypothetical protein